MAEPRVATDDDPPPPSGLVDAIIAYEAAVASEDRGTPAADFERGAHTVRADSTGVVEGPDAAAPSRSPHLSSGKRHVESLVIHRAGPGVAHVMSVTVSARGSRGSASQLWRQGDDGRWRIAATHLT